MISRVLTAIAGIPILAFAALSESLWPIRLVSFALYAIAVFEIQRAEDRAFRWAPPILIALFGVSAWIWNGAGSWVLAIGALVAFAILWFEVFGDRGGGIWRGISVVILQLSWVGFGFISVIALRAHDTQGGALFSMATGSYLMLVFLCVWAGDTFAFFVGRAVGKRFLAPNISPKKTWEGSVAYLIASVLAGYVGGRFFGFDSLASLSVGVTVGVLGQIGDLFQSAWKRSVSIKDSGTLLPGHGGVLDRFDSIIYCAPAVILILNLAARN